MYNVVYNSRNLGANGYYIYKIDVNMPKTIVNKYELIQTDGNIVTGRFYGERIISVSGRIEATSLDDMQTKLDTLKGYTIGYEKELDVTMGSTVRRYVGTVTNFNYKTTGYHCEWSIDFTCDSIGEDANSSSLVFGTYTSTGTSYANTIGGTYFAEPSFDFVINQIDPYWTAKYIDIRNAVLNQRMRFTRNWKWGEHVVVNGRTKTALVYPTTSTVIDNMDTITSWTSAHTLSLDSTNMKEGVGCNKVVMGSATTSSYLQRLNATAVDLSSSSGYVLLPIFIPTPTSGTVSTIRLQAGSDATLASNYVYWDITTQWNGSAFSTNAWNFVRVDLSVAPTNTTGTPVRTAIISIQISLRDGSSFQLNGWLADYLTVYLASAVAEPIDYEGTIPDMDIGSTTLIVSDELTSRNVTMTGSYYKRYL